MKVKDVIIFALYLIGRSDIATSISTGATVSAEGQEVINVLLYCFNATEDEVARKYIPLTAKEQLSAENGEYYYSKFAHSPIRIKNITAEGKDVKFKLEPLYVAVNAKNITVEYDYAPAKKNMAGESDFVAEVSENLLATGMVAEYHLINGEVEEYELWEKRYRKLIDEAQRILPSGGTVPPRRWV